MAPNVGSLREELEKWGKKIDREATKSLSKYFPNPSINGEVDCYISTHTISCPNCGSEIPLIRNWHVKTKKAGTEVVAKPTYSESGEISYRCIKSPDKEDLDGFDPNDGPVSRGGNAKCPSCEVVTEDEVVQSKLRDSEFKFDIYGVKYFSPDGQSHIRSPEETDYEALRQARERIESEYRLSTLLDTDIPEGEKTDEPRSYGMTQWRDVFNPRQLVSHYEYLNAFEKYKPETLICRCRYLRDLNSRVARVMT